MIFCTTPIYACMNLILHLIKKIFRSIWHIIATIALLLLGLHFWFIYNSEKTIEGLITWASNGKLTGEIKNFKINYVNNNIDIKNLTIYNTDSSAQSTSYRFSVKGFHLKIRSSLDLILHRQLHIDSIVFNYPDITVTRRGGHGSDTTGKKLLLAEELGNVYKTISQSLSVLHLERFEINEGKILIKDAGNGGSVPFILSHIFFSIDKLNIDSASLKKTSKFIFSDRIVLRIENQNIVLPDNKSNVAFRELLIDSKEKSIRITGPAVNILPLNQQKNSFTASALGISITGLDFNALYQQQLIKADSVSITKPAGRADIYINEKDKGTPDKRKTPLDSVLHHLPIAVDISHIVMQNGDGVAYLHKAGKTTSFKTQNDNISIVGLRISDSLENLLEIDGFHYTIRNYIGHTPDSIYSFRFDSLQFIDNKIVLHHFTVTTIGKTKTGLIRNYAVPRLEITGMDWFSFILGNHFKAKNAVLYNPILSIEKNHFSPGRHKPPNEHKRSVYQELSLMDNLLDLDGLQIVNGNFSFTLENNLTLQLQQLNLNVDANELTKAKSFNQIVHSVKQLSFDTATAANSSISLRIGRSDFNNKEGDLMLDKIVLNAANGDINAQLTGIGLNDFSFSNNELEVNGIYWKEGFIHITGQNGILGKPGRGDKAPALILTNIMGNNTSVSFENKKESAGVFLKTLSAKSLLKRPDEPVHLEDLLAAGNDIRLDLPDGRLRCSEFSIRDQQESLLQNIQYEQRTAGDTLSINAPVLRFTPSLNKIIETGAITLAGFSISNASVRVHAMHESSNTVLTCAPLSLNIQSIETQRDHSLLASNLSFHTDHVTFGKNDSVALKAFGNTDFTLSSFLYHPSTRDWKMQVGQFISDSVQYSTLRRDNRNGVLTLVQLKAERLNVTNADLKRPLPWLINRSGANIELGFVHWQDDNTNLQVTGFQFDQNEKRVNIHALSVDPGKSRNAFTNDLVYRKDYMQAASGQMQIDGVEIDDGLLQVRHINMDNPVLNVYSDKLKKPGAETLKPLPVKALEKMALPLRVNKVQLNNMLVSYTELNAGTRQSGRVYFARICGDVSNITSRPDLATDSLHVNVRANFLDTMRLHLDMKESYADPLSGLRLQLQVGQGNLYLLNSFLAPLVSIRVKSGYLDTMSMTAVGNEYVSHGDMRMYYHGLKADILDSGSTQHRSFGTGLLTFFANTLAIRNYNNAASNRQADFHFVRIRDNSAINYFLKMVVKGATGNVAPVSKIIYRKQYRKDMKKLAARHLLLDAPIGDEPHHRYRHIERKSQPGIQESQEDGYRIDNNGEPALPVPSKSQGKG